MTKKEAMLILATLRAAFPQAYANYTQADTEAAVNLWTEMFDGDTGAEVSAAVKALIATRTNSFPPAIGEVKEQLYKLRHQNDLKEDDAWNLVVKAVRNSGYHAMEEFDRLPEIVKQCVGSPNQLRDWGLMDSDDFFTVIQSHFLRAFRARSQSEREMDKLPEDVRQMLTESMSRFLLE